MPCYHPVTAYQSIHTGKVRVVGGKSKWFPSDARAWIHMMLPCGSCVGCRLEHSRQWATRCLHEASLYDDNCFITLTYNAEHLPRNGSLVPRDLQLFLKRLRKKYGANIRFYACGEYGELNRRPHYHACIFNHDFADKYAWKRSESGELLFRSEELEKLWKKGHSSIGAVTFESAAYVARYIMKKVNGDAQKDHYNWPDDNGNRYSRVPEFTRMSLRPGIGSGWFERYHSDVYPGDFVVINGKKSRPPRFYDERLKKIDPEAYEKLKEERRERAKEHAENNTDERLAVRETIQKKRLDKLGKSL